MSEIVLTIKIYWYIKDPWKRCIIRLRGSEKDCQDERPKGYQADTPEPAVSASHHMCCKDSPPTITSLRRPPRLTLVVLILGTASS